MQKIFNWVKCMSINKKLIISFFIILTIPGIIIGGVSYQTAKTNFEHQMTDKAKENISVLNTVISQNIEEKFVDATYFAYILTEDTYPNGQEEIVRTKLAQYIKLHPEVEGIYIGTETGKFIREPFIQMADGYNPTDRSWYKEAHENKGKVIVTAPYQSASTKNMVVTIAKEVKDGKGVIGINLNLDNILKISKMINIGEKGYAVILDQNKQIVSHPSRKPGAKVTDPWIKPIYEDKQGNVSYTEQDDKKNLIFATNEKTGWKVVGVMFDEEITQAASPVFYKTLIVIAIAIAFGSVLIYFITKSITRPLRKIAESAYKISKGDLTEKITIHSKDDIGKLGNSFNEMSTSLQDVITQISFSAEHVAASAEELTASVQQANDATDQITIAMEQVSGGAESQSQGVEEGAATLQQVNTAIQDVTGSAESISISSLHARERAEEGEDLVEQTAKQMQSISKSVSESDAIIKLLDEKSKQVGAISEAIQNIATQTNLLALNAAIEAARAGEQGRGFAIVADEVRKLAEQSGESSGEIANLIAEIKADIEHTVKAMDNVNGEVQQGLDVVTKTKVSFTEILSSTTHIVSQVNQMVETTKRIAGDANEVTNAIDEIAAAAEENTASMQSVAASTEGQVNSMEEISSASQNLAEMAEELQAMTSKFKV
ncbi:chemotaxis protein [Bacillus thuringiensis]|uniref:Methyl-accepting chemotaxis protein n=3 Tax=Bacillus thuringiensis TaxID=1428 RepID=A0A9W3S723_BACTU|nr:methyl-accepting chemotaxis protein [Bacillus thuringiensis]ANS46183.1 putative methyl-accepting chemotaxis protein [Bacillus thuringiensis]MBH0339060.1 chemotaxis protein [Bacillus thuringiensis]